MSSYAESRQGGSQGGGGGGGSTGTQNTKLTEQDKNYLSIMSDKVQKISISSLGEITGNYDDDFKEKAEKNRKETINGILDATKRNQYRIHYDSEIYEDAINLAKEEALVKMKARAKQEVEKYGHPELLEEKIKKEIEIRESIITVYKRADRAIHSTCNARFWNDSSNRGELLRYVKNQNSWDSVKRRFRDGGFKLTDIWE